MTSPVRQVYLLAASSFFIGCPERVSESVSNCRTCCAMATTRADIVQYMQLSYCTCTGPPVAFPGVQRRHAAVVVGGMRTHESITRDHHDAGRSSRINLPPRTQTRFVTTFAEFVSQAAAAAADMLLLLSSSSSSSDVRVDDLLGRRIRSTEDLILTISCIVWQVC